MIKYLCIYFISVSIAAALLTVADKHRAVKKKSRIPEDFLLTIGLIGGAAAEYITMKLIRHKTKHKKFMLGLPAEILFHILVAALIIVYK